MFTIITGYYHITFVIQLSHYQYYCTSLISSKSKLAICTLKIRFYYCQNYKKLPKLAISCQFNSTATAFKNCQTWKLFFARSCQNWQLIGNPLYDFTLATDSKNGHFLAKWITKWPFLATICFNNGWPFVANCIDGQYVAKFDPEICHFWNFQAVWN